MGQITAYKYWKFQQENRFQDADIISLNKTH